MFKISSFLLVILFVGNVYSLDLLYGSWNIKYDSPKDSASGNIWEKRLPQITSAISFFDIDIISLQEVKKNQLDELNQKLPQYGFVHNNDVTLDNVILFKKEHFILEKQGQIWFSESQKRNAIGWDAGVPRFCTWALFKSRASKQKFYVFNVHLDHKGTIAKIESAKLLVNKVLSISTNEAFVISGDFNTPRTKDAFKIMNSSPKIKYALDIAQIQYLPTDSYNYFNPQKKSGWTLDHIFVGENVTVLRYGILPILYYDNKWRYPSDHNPIFSEISF